MIKIYIQLPYFNKHITPIFERLKSYGDVRIGLLNPGSMFRKGYEWDRDIDPNIYIKLWKTQLSIHEICCNFDVIGVHGIFPIGRNFDLTKAAIRSKKRVFIVSEGIKNPSIFSRIYRNYFTQQINSKLVILFAIGSGAIEDFNRICTNNWIKVPFAYSVDEIKIENHYTGNIVKLLFVGQLIQRKRIMDLLESLSDINDSFYQLTIIGDGKLKLRISDFIVKNSLSDKVTVKGLMTHSDVLNEMLGSDCLILPSGYDGWGAVINEAMECGLAIICSDMVRAKLLLTGEPNGYVFKVGNTVELAKCLSSIINDRNLLRIFKTNSRKKIRNYRPDYLAEMVYQSITEFI